MEPLNDNELNQLLRRWEAPDAPQSLRISSVPRVSLWRWLWTGRIHVPVPVGVAAFVFIAAFWVISVKTKSAGPGAPSPVGNAVHSVTPSEAPPQQVTPKPAPVNRERASPETPPHPESAALAGFRPVSPFEPKVVGVVK